MISAHGNRSAPIIRVCQGAQASCLLVAASAALADLETILAKEPDPRVNAQLTLVLTAIRASR